MLVLAVPAGAVVTQLGSNFLSCPLTFPNFATESGDQTMSGIPLPTLSILSRHQQSDSSWLTMVLCGGAN